MGNSVVRQTIFRGSRWTNDWRRDGGDIVQVETIAEPPEERREHGAAGKKNSSDDGRETLDIDGTKHVATGRTEIRELFNDVAAPETGNREDDDGECRSLVVRSIVTVWRPSGQLLVVATKEWFTQTFVVEYKAPDPDVARVASVAGVASVTVVASVVTVKESVPIRRRQIRRSADEAQGADED
ncbi:hypothetical protein FWK35_00006658 [Aphis craccivora]|uniref:Uncharacterized protein n=1 Tax=Aphis craccivora TaxID=307492 RepID=A0A6G0ZMN1_APHCR|nr:hypothetical protein FWK35_00006658 [Aphis craccivora]